MRRARILERNLSQGGNGKDHNSNHFRPSLARWPPASQPASPSSAGHFWPALAQVAQVLAAVNITQSSFVNGLFGCCCLVVNELKRETCANCVIIIIFTCVRRSISLALVLCSASCRLCSAGPTTGSGPSKASTSSRPRGRELSRRLSKCDDLFRCLHTVADESDRKPARVSLYTIIT